jgi:hypothetical protein
VTVLTINIRYDSITDLFEAELPNGARFFFTRSDIGGKLESNLTLFRRAVVAASVGHPLPESKDSTRAWLASLDIKPASPRLPKAGKLSLGDLDLDL